MNDEREGIIWWRF